MASDINMLTTEELLKKYDPSHCLDRYFQQLIEENKKINLVSRETIASGASGLPRLAAESLAPLECIEPIGLKNYLDIGSGGGFPSFPLGLCLDIKNITLIERTLKKAKALERMAVILDMSPDIIPKNFDECKLQNMFDLITLRLVKLSDNLLRKISILLNNSGYFIYYNDIDNAKTYLEKYSLDLQEFRYRIDSSDITKIISILKKVR